MRKDLLLFAALVVGCAPGGGGGGNGGTQDATTEADQGAVDAAAGDAGLEALLDDFCTRQATAKCEWAFECVGGGQIYTGLGLQGPAVEDCVEDLRDGCLEDANDRAGRGTLEFGGVAAIDECVERLADGPCPPGAVSEWVEQWRSYAFNACKGVVRGTRAADEACERRRDCRDESNICAIGKCRAAEPRDVMAPCTATGDLPGELNADPLCAGASCAALQPNDEMLDGICTIDCSDGAHRCPQGTGCLQLQVSGQAPSWICTATCTMPQHCVNGFSCVKYDPNDISDARHCYVTSSD